ncbi:MAG: TonB family protein, partial [Bacteroidetes bacterium]|nr:TonB family protein [Bacteroidota bacterium]
MAESLVVPYVGSGYGAVELKQVYQKYMAYAIVIASVSIASFVGSYHVIQWLSEEEEPMHTVRIMKYTDLGPPPSLQSNQAAPAVAVSGPAVRPSVGIPVPVPDAEVSPEQTIASQTELSAQAAPSLDVGDGTGGGAIEQDLRIEDEGPPPDFVPYEKEPTVVKKIDPKYPEIALRAGLEGNVYVKVWVDKEGKVRKVVVLKSDAEIFNEAAIEAAKQWVFTPAVMQKGPV